ncbi:MAG: regulatory protein RecX, partial [Bradymonadaceae bacterium]
PRVAMTDDKPPTRTDVEAAALTYLARRDHAEGELRKKLRKKDFDDTLIDEVFDDYRQRGYLDDTRFAVDQGFILVRKQWGPLQIIRKLRDRGVLQNIIDIALTEIELETDWTEVCQARLTSRFTRDPKNLTDKDRQRAYRHLKNRGFPSNVIHRILW